jgi:K+-transporting ATPase A subunit
MIICIFQYERNIILKYYACIFILLLIIVSCNKQEYRDVMKFYSQDFPETIHLEGKELKFDRKWSDLWILLD